MWGAYLLFQCLIRGLSQVCKVEHKVLGSTHLSA